MSELGNKEVMAKNLRFYLSKSGKDRSELCKDLNISYSTFTDWLNGKKYPRIDSIERMANYFGIQKADLIEETRGDNTARTEDEKHVLLLARHLEKIPEATRKKIIKNFEDTISTYLEAMGIDKGD
mgnify:CR=1 FL=1